MNRAEKRRMQREAARAQRTPNIIDRMRDECPVCRGEASETVAFAVFDEEGHYVDGFGYPNRGPGDES